MILFIMKGIVYDVVDGEYFVAHTDYFLQFDYHGVATNTLTTIKNGKSQLKLKELKNSSVDTAFDKIMNWYNTSPRVSYKFKSYRGATSVDFVHIPEVKFKLLEKMCINQ